MAQELKAFIVLYNGKFIRVYPENKVNKMLAEKDKEIAELKQKLESVQASMDADLIDAGMENRRLKRALYKACSNWAKSERYTEATWHGDEHREESWANVQTKCLAKVEQYK